MRTTLKRGVGRGAEHNGNGKAVFPPGTLSTVTRYRQPPAPPVRCDRSVEAHRVVAGVEHEKERLAGAVLDQTGERPRVRIVPIQWSPGRSEPADLLAGVEMLAGQYRVGATQRDHVPGELVDVTVALEAAPVVPARLVVLAVSIVVASLRATELVASQEHRYAA